LYKTCDEKLKIIKEKEKCEIDGDYIIGYKEVDEDRFSPYGYLYSIGDTKEKNAGIDEKGYLFGFGVYLKYIDNCKEGKQIIKVKVHKDNIYGLGRDHIIYCSKMTILT